MTDIAILNQPATPTVPPAPSAKIGGDFDTFLRMLTTQIRYQDPLNPMDGADFAVQLATFSGVEQQVQTNSLLQAMAAQQGGSLADFSGWIGQEVRVTAPVQFSDQPLTLDLRPDPSADQAVLLTLDQYGRVVTREQVGTASGAVEWFGRDAAGNRLPPGLYSFRLENIRDGAPISERPVAAYGVVDEIEHDGGTVRLVLEGGASVAADTVQAVRRAAR
ncbi:MAG: flagellar hook capping FlgD N-terminal domain-containing protein [Paracoccus sp. (in: a-proteobacteria)]|nr:flagellar hook capping FlgD N-terminal domain-containing protein [Paracoccus sp. (in: a-proteobacteria)]